MTMMNALPAHRHVCTRDKKERRVRGESHQKLRDRIKKYAIAALNSVEATKLVTAIDLRYTQMRTLRKLKVPDAAARLAAHRQEVEEKFALLGDIVACSDQKVLQGVQAKTAYLLSKEAEA
jgi:hypothetical protein